MLIEGWVILTPPLLLRVVQQSAGFYLKVEISQYTRILPKHMSHKEPPKFVTALVVEDSILTSVEVRGHQFQCDETEKYGGQDQHPDPYDYILSGLASCVAITLRQYADRHNMSLECAEVRCSYEKNNKPGAPKKDKITKSIK